MANLELADRLFSDEVYGQAIKCYRECLETTKEFQPDNKQRIEYIERKIEECAKLLPKQK